MYRDISLLVCALQGPQFDPGGEGMRPLTDICITVGGGGAWGGRTGPLTDICNTIGVGVGGWGEQGHLQIYVTL